MRHPRQTEDTQRLVVDLVDAAPVVDGQQPRAGALHDEPVIALAFLGTQLGSLDANQGDKLIGWDMDEFPTDLYETSTVMWEVLAEGQIGPHGGLNFDAKPRRTSFTAEDLFRSHIAGMDSFAAGLLVAAKMHEDKVIENLQAERYSSFDSGIGATVENGTASLASLEEYALDIPQSKLIEATKSDHLESVKATINNYMIDALAEA